MQYDATHVVILDNLKSTDVSINDIDGNPKNFRIHRVPATMGREIFTQYAPTAMPKVGDYKSNQDLMYKLITFVKVEAPDGSMLRLSPQLLDAHVTDFEMLIKLEWEMVKFNTSFLNRENRSNLLKKFKGMAEKYLNTLTSSQSSD